MKIEHLKNKENTRCVSQKYKISSKKTKRIHIYPTCTMQNHMI